jgi:uncharacterized protein YndB with AHSA1/START domain
VRRGREKLHYLNVEPINAMSDRWINQYDRARIQALADLETAMESPPLNGSEPFVYTTYIRTTPERLWQAITEPAFSVRYLGHAMFSSWEKGAAYTWVDHGLEIAHPDQIVLESDPYARLAFTFHTFVPEIASIAEVDAQTLAQAAVERRSRVAVDIEQVDGQVKLTVTHDGFDPGSVVRPLICDGWPYKLSNLKSGLELG